MEGLGWAIAQSVGIQFLEFNQKYDMSPVTAWQHPSSFLGKGKIVQREGNKRWKLKYTSCEKMR